MSFLNGTDPGLRQTKVPVVDTYTAGVGFTAGSTTALTLSGDPGSENACEVSFDGILQHGSTFSHSGTTLTFSSAIPTGVSEVQVRHAGAIPATEPADGSVSVGKLSTTGTPSSSTFLRGDMAWAAAGGGKLLQVVQGELTTTATTTSTTYVQTGITANITPSATSSKILISYNLAYHGNNNYYSKFDLRRGGTTIYPNPSSPGSRTASLGGMMALADAGNMWNLAGEYLDSPSSTSALTYEIYFGRSASTSATYVNRSQVDTDQAGYGRASSVIILKEIGV